MSKIIIFGTGEIAEVAHFYLTHDSDHEVIAFTIDAEFIKTEEFCGLPVVAFEQLIGLYPPSEVKLLIPIGYGKVNSLRALKYAQAKKLGYSFISYISSKADYYGTAVGENCFILENNVIQPFASIGNNCILWSGNHIGHHTKIEDHCFIASHVVISGCVVVGEYSFVGVNATIRDNVMIGKENVIGAGAVILSNTEDKAVYASIATQKSKVPSDRLRGI